MRAALLATIVFATPVLAQAPAAETKPSDERTTAQKARAPLKLRLDELNGPAPIITFTPRDNEKKDAAARLPSLGGTPSRRLERPISDVVPKDVTGGQ